MRNMARLHAALKAANVPITGVSDTEPVTIHFRTEANDFQRQQAQQIVDRFDWSPEADARFAAEQSAAAAKDALDNDMTPVWKTLRGLASIAADLAAEFPGGGGKPSRALVRDALKLEIEGDQAFPERTRDH